MEETDFARRMDLMIEAEKLLVEEDAALSALYFEGSASLKKPYIKNYVNQPYGGGREFKLWKVEK